MVARLGSGAGFSWKTGMNFHCSAFPFTVTSLRAKKSQDWRDKSEGQNFVKVRETGTVHFSSLTKTKTKICERCGEPYKPKCKWQRFCNKCRKKDRRKYPNCLWCGQLLPRKNYDSTVSHFCCQDHALLFRIYGKSKAEAEKT